MPLIRRNWTPAEADEWTREDWYAIVMSPLAYLLLTVGTALSMMLLPAGYLILAAGALVTILMHWVIDPKLKVVSSEYEKRQHDYLEELERSARWKEDNNG
ncbi:MAG: hypothetical protein KIT09_06105 [Bryobacteraceae bacterium]|nr:hypothetical protein [Bryobacteraceae bacterium]